MIDAHLHLWDPARLTYDWLSHVSAIADRHGPEQWADNGASVRRAVFVQADCAPDQALAEVDWVCGLDHPALTIEAIVAFAPLELGEAVRPHLETLKARPRVRGVRRLLQGETDDFITSDAHLDGLIATVDADLTADLCVTARQLPAVIRMLARLHGERPEARVVLDHLGKPDIAAQGADVAGDDWAANIDRLATFPRLFAKVSGLPTQDRFDAPRADAMTAYIDHAVTAFGPDRLMFGGDWPVVDLAGGYAPWLAVVEASIRDLPTVAKDRIRFGSAEEFYRIDRAGPPAGGTA